MKKEKVLIIEDELDLLDLVDFNLTRKGFVTAGAFDGLSAMEKIESFGPDIVILDLMLPGLDGWEICRSLKEVRRDVPVVMLTAKSLPEDKDRGFDAGADDYITKPFNVKELITKIENLLEKKRAKDLQRILVHEMTNRLATIGCYTDILSRKEELLSTEKQSAYIRVINDQAAAASDLVSEMGAVMDVESGEFGRTGRCDVVEILTRTAESYKNPAAQKNIRIELSADDAVPDVLANEFALKQVFTNLIGNAVKYNRENGYVGISARAEGSGVVVSIWDHGIGIPEADLSRIFEKRYRAGNVPSGVPGSGLGLYIARQLLERTGAVFTFSSTEGEGSVFSILFRQTAPSPPGQTQDPRNRDITSLS